MTERNNSNADLLVTAAPASSYYQGDWGGSGPRLIAPICAYEELDAEARKLDLLVDPDTLQPRRRDRQREQSAKGPTATPTTRWRTLQAAIIGQAHRGADIHIGKLG